MNFNTILLRLGLDPDDFVNKLSEPIRTKEGFIYEADQEIKERICPYCHSHKVIIHDHDIIEVNCSQTDQIRDILRIRKTRLMCKDCKKTFTPDISGIDRYSRISRQSLDMIINDFFKPMSFTAIGERYGLSVNRIIQIFDEKISFVPRKTLPGTLCIDEKRFAEEFNQKYCCVLYDFDSGMITDVIRNRQLPYLEEYFSSIKESERNRVRYFISDMNDPYRSIKKKYFPKALHIVDLFHVIRLLNEAVRKIRVKAMNRYGKEKLEYGFMKRHWKLFQCRKEDIPNKMYMHRKSGLEYPLSDLLLRCVFKDHLLNEAYNILQDIYHYKERFYSFTEAFEFIMYIADRLLISGDELLEAVGRSYRKWAAEIANGLSYSQNGRRFTNGIAECDNNHIDTLIKIAYGYHNFERFRKRVLLIRTYKKDLNL